MACISNPTPAAPPYRQSMLSRQRVGDCGGGPVARASEIACESANAAHPFCNTKPAHVPGQRIVMNYAAAGEI